MNILLIILLAVAVYVAMDVRRRGIPLLLGVFAVLGTLFLPIIIIPMYFLMRPRFSKSKPTVSTVRGPSRICTKCGTEVRSDQATCHHCGNVLTVS